MDAVALGVRPPVVDPLPVPSPVPKESPLPNVNTTLATPSRPAAVPEPSNAAVAPVNPPGLTEEPDQVDTLDLQPPTTPLTTPTPDSPSLRPSASGTSGDSETRLIVPPSPHQHQHPGSSSQQHQDSAPSTPASPATPSASTFTLGNLLHTLRHAPSKAIRTNGKEIVPPLPPPKSSSASSHSNEPGNVAGQGEGEGKLKGLSVPNGKEKGDHHHKGLHMTGTWFRRKSLRVTEEKEKEKGAAASSVPSTSMAERSHSLGREKEKEKGGDHRDKDKDDGPAAWFRHATRLARRASETEFHDPHTSSTPHFLSHLSTSSPFSHHSSSHYHASSHHATSVSTPASPNLYPVPEHKKSTSDLPATGRREAVELPERPATAENGGSRSGRRQRPKSTNVPPPLPPLPPPKDRKPGVGINSSSSSNANGDGKAFPVQMRRDTVPSSPQGHRHTVHGGDTTLDRHQHHRRNIGIFPLPEDKMPIGLRVSPSNGSAFRAGEQDRRPSGAESEVSSLGVSRQMSLGALGENGTSSTLSMVGGGVNGNMSASGSGEGSELAVGSGFGSGGDRQISSPPTALKNQHRKKATRKLSFTTPLLGLVGKKDKEKHQKEHKDRHDAHSSSHPPTGTATFFT